jgi:dTDP-4-dehydrorhamnose reductase
MTRRILLTGKTGQVGSELLRVLPKLGDVVAPGRGELDLSRADDIRRVVREARPELIVNAAAYTGVDAAESHEEEARLLNAVAPGVLAEEARKIGAGIVHYSTDYVFDGAKQTPYVETDTSGPLSVYGRTKLDGEKAVMESGSPYLILRTAWIYATRGKNFLLTILRLAAEREELRIVSDQIGAPTLASQIAAGTMKVLLIGEQPLREKSGIYHLTAGGETNWHAFAVTIVLEARSFGEKPDWMRTVTGGRGLSVKRVNAITTAEYPTPARRPAYSALSNNKIKEAFGVELPDWREQLHSVFATTPNENS